ncbi:MAG: histone deacetylase family protein [Alphaproteobacteria bacterium]|nr:histone deacetylase family protein [Alphaproteobacteria bacterium]
MITLYDPVQRSHAPETFLVAGRPQPIPERPERIDMLMQGVAAIGSEVRKPPAIDLATVGLVHDAGYLDFLVNLRERWGHVSQSSDIPLPNVYAIGRSSLPPATLPDAVVGQAGFYLGDGACPVTKDTLAAALGSAACAAEAARLVLKGERLTYALCRPPGHHAAADLAAGFCFFNNSALAAEMLTKGGKRTAILDIDVHHGNGTAAIFYDRADVLTVSIHANPKRIYPFFWGYADERGRGAGEGFNLNLPLERGTEIDAYKAALETALQRIADFAPEILVIAAGLDIAIDDPFKGFAIRTEDFTTIGVRIAQMNLPMTVIQEGGYPSPSLGVNLAALLKGLGA